MVFLRRVCTEILVEGKTLLICFVYYANVMNMKKKELRVIDFFCGAGGFSEGFRQQGYRIVRGIDNWKPAVDTHNLNHQLNDKVQNVLDYEDIDNIDKEDDYEIIVGSPPCVSFSSSNKAGKADKSLGIRLIKAYLRFVAVKKHQKNSKLVAWLMENVPNSSKHIKEEYTFEDLNLTEWAKKNGLSPQSIALRANGANGKILVSSDYGSPQNRKRFVCGEVISTGQFPMPDKVETPHGVKLGDIIDKLPSPFLCELNDRLIQDPNYSQLKIKVSELTDHYYDTGIYEIEWRTAQINKQNHPFMGRMSFPENKALPSRTIMATRSATTREAILFESEIKRKGDGQYRMPTIREVSSLMGFPITYQFLGSESTKWRLIGNAVCPHLSFALAKKIKQMTDIDDLVEQESISFNEQLENYSKVDNLNRPGIFRNFSKPPIKKKGARYRGHPIKLGNVTIALMNYHMKGDLDSEPDYKWKGYIFYGTGQGFYYQRITSGLVNQVESLLIELQLENFINCLKEEFPADSLLMKQLEELWENSEIKHTWHPYNLMRRIEKMILPFNKTIGVSDLGITVKKDLPLSQLLAIFTIGRLVGSQYS